MDEWILQMEAPALQLRRAKADSEQQSSITVDRGPFYRMPDEHFREGCVPHEISIGPYHHPKGEFYKKKCLTNFLNRYEVPLKNYIDNLAEIVDEVRDMYDGLDDCWRGEDKKEAFLQMMVLDGCYLLEIMEEAGAVLLWNEPHTDATVFNPNKMDTYRHDMLLLDNQIPFKVLTSILEMSVHSSSRRWIEIVIRDFFSVQGPFIKSERISITHLLGAYRLVLLGGELNKCSIYGAPQLFSYYYEKFPSATKLEEANLEIKPSLHNHQTYISFNKRKGLVLQQIVVDDSTSSHFFKVILYEKFDSTVTMNFSSYIHFMHCLLKDTEDYRLLRSRGVLRTNLLEEEMIEVFKRLFENISFSNDKLMDSKIWELGKNLSKQYDKNMQTWRKDLFQTYLRSPWAIISVIAAFLLFTLTAFQTVYTILGYYKGKK